MSRKYVRSTLRASWSENDVNEAMEKVKSKCTISYVILAAEKSKEKM